MSKIDTQLVLREVFVEFLLSGSFCFKCLVLYTVISTCLLSPPTLSVYSPGFLYIVVVSQLLFIMILVICTDSTRSIVRLVFVQLFLLLLELPSMHLGPTVV